MENVFNIKYNTKLDRLELPKENLKERVVNNIKKHKFITIIIFSFIIFSTVDFYLIYSFMKVLENI